MAVADREKALEAALAHIEKHHGKGSVMRLGDQSQAEIEVSHWLSLSLLPATHVRDRVAAQLATVPPSEALRREAAALLEHVDRDGASDDGAIVLLARRVSGR